MKVLKESILSPTKVKKLAKEVGLDCIDYNINYRIFKTSSKNDSTHSIEKTEVCEPGKIQLIGQLDSVWISTIGISSWFKTSPVINCYKLNSNNIRVETFNSFYILEPLS
jgi:hypothetical protein